jgi:16S rRNA (cytidine1402-2'-O)-methyltransferase
VTVVPGTLYIVATPIGNLADMTYRAVQTLGEVDRIACEDTRETHKLLSHYGIATRPVSYHEHNEAARAAELLDELEGGLNIAVVSDAGTPLISDPGYRLVRGAVERGIRVVPIPGVSAAVTALSAAGLASDEFRFCGFFPRKSGERKRALEALRGEQATLIFYEAPHRIVETLADVESELADPPVVVARELTKLHEEFLRGSASEVRQRLVARDSIRGEMTVLIGKQEKRVVPDEPVADSVRRLEGAGMARMDAIKQVARERGLPKREVYKLFGNL